MKRFSRQPFMVCALALLLLTAANAQAQASRDIVRRVNFPRGRTTAVLRGTVRPGVGVEYLLRARAGQTMIVHLASPGDVGFTIWSPNREFMADFRRDWTGELPQDGTYRVIVSPNSDRRPMPFTLEVTIR